MAPPTAMQAFADVQETAPGSQSLLPGRRGVDLIIHRWPFQLSAKGLEVPKVRGDCPEAMQALADVHDTPTSKPPWVGWGGSSYVQRLPFKRSTIGLTTGPIKGP